MYGVRHELQYLLPSTASRSQVTGPVFPPVPPPRGCWGRWKGEVWEEQAKTRGVSSAAVSGSCESRADLTDTDETWW